MGQQNNRQYLCNNYGKSFHTSYQDLVYYTTVQDSQFGRIPVYSSSKKPSSYIAKVQTTIENSKIFNIFQHIQNSQVSSLASLHAFDIQRKKYFTGQSIQQITAYWEYYNYFFIDYMRIRALKKIPFTQKEIWLIIKSCCESYCLFSSYNLVLDINVNHIVLVPQGKIKIYWHQVEYDNSHLKFYKKLKQKMNQKKSLKKQNENTKFKNEIQDQLNNFFYSPQEIQAIQKKQQTMNIDFARANSFRLGMLILYCITLTNPIKTCYGKSRENKKIRIKVMVLNSLYQNTVQNSNKYSQDLKHLVKLLLLQDPNKRIPITCLMNVYEKLLMSQQTQLLMGMPENPLFTQHTEEKDQKQQHNQQNKQDKNLGILNLPSYDNLNILNSRQPIISEKNSFKMIQNSHIKSSRHSRINDLSSSDHSKSFDRDDTKTIKIKTHYHKK